MSPKRRAPSVYSHIVVHDYGFAPNPYGEILSLATCKPRIRRTAHVGDWIVGVGSVGTVGPTQVVYAFLVDEIVPIEVYGREERFSVKIPSFRVESWRRVGDNAYYLDEKGSWVRRPSLHDASRAPQDLSGKRVLLGHEYYYFGSSAPKLPDPLDLLSRPGRDFRRFEDAGLISELASWLRSTYRPGILGDPYHPSLPKHVAAHNAGAAPDTNRASRSRRR